MLSKAQKMKTLQQGSKLGRWIVEYYILGDQYNISWSFKSYWGPNNESIEGQIGFEKQVSFCSPKTPPPTFYLFGQIFAQE